MRCIIVAVGARYKVFWETEGGNGWDEMEETMQDVQKVHPARPQPMEAPEA
jgi:hypothetical protein